MLDKIVGEFSLATFRGSEVNLKQKDLHAVRLLKR
jgi:hypothetical protein